MLKLMDGRIRILHVILIIPGLARNFISISKMDNASVKTIVEKETCKMV
jgi:hypothetical protein